MVDERVDGLSEQIIDMREGMSSLATKQQLENRFDLLATSMRNLSERMGQLEDDVENLRERVH